jgi:hypothetical protein
LGLSADDFGKGLDTAGFLRAGELFGIDGSGCKGGAFGGVGASLFG